jgi:hypothetical protein
VNTYEKFVETVTAGISDVLEKRDISATPELVAEITVSALFPDLDPESRRLRVAELLPIAERHVFSTGLVRQ